MQVNQIYGWLLAYFMINGVAYGQASQSSVQQSLVEFGYHSEIFPKTWNKDKIRAHGEPLDSLEYERTTKVLSKALAKYPDSLLSQSLEAIYVLKSMTLFNQLFGGANHQGKVYLTNAGRTRGYTDEYIEQTFHHEFSSVLYRKNVAHFDHEAWHQMTMEEGKYGQGGIHALTTNQSSTIFDTTLCRVGFLYEFAVSDLENDFNAIAENLFLSREAFWNIVDQYPKIKGKTSLAIQFYQKLNPIFTETYFRNLGKE